MQWMVQYSNPFLVHDVNIIVILELLTKVVSTCLSAPSEVLLLALDSKQ